MKGRITRSLVPGPVLDLALPATVPDTPAPSALLACSLATHGARVHLKANGTQLLGRPLGHYQLPNAPELRVIKYEFTVYLVPFKA